MQNRFPDDAHGDLCPTDPQLRTRRHPEEPGAPGPEHRPPRHRLVARRGLLPDLHPQLRRRERRRRRRPGRHPQPAAVPRRPRRRRPVDHAVLPLADGRPRLRRRRSARRRAGVRRPRRVRRAARRGPRARPPRDDRPGAQPQLATSTSWFQAGAGRRARARPSGRATCSATAAARTAASRRTTGRRSSAGPRGRRVPDGQWYLHLFAPEQPDLDFTNPEVLADLEETMRFWLDRGVDGFRIDVAHGMAKPDGLPDMVPMEDTGLLADHGPGDLRFDQDGVHAVHRRIRAVLDEYPGTMAVGEVWVSDDDAAGAVPARRRAAAGVQLQAADRRVGRRRAARRGRRTRWPRSARRPAPACWVLSNHDVRRHVTPLRRRRARRSGGPGRRRCCSWPCRARSTSTTATSWGCPTSTCPTRCCRTRSGSGRAAPERGRDACRVPMPWSGERARRTGSRRAARHVAADARRAGAALTVEAQAADPVVDAVAVPSGAARCARRPRRSGRGARVAAGARGLPGVPPSGRAGVPGEPLRRGGARCPRGRVLLASADVAGRHAARPTRRCGCRPEEPGAGTAGSVIRRSGTFRPTTTPALPPRVPRETCVKTKDLAYIALFAAITAVLGLLPRRPGAGHPGADHRADPRA